ncbi:hypothetical protein K469DRAFT_810324 [Zopfia rhizophila CBS 207.26]|uniref:Uncharacterized protein n=1 Tax=Zopfia rhizophila CBS 207.26 TaxID=1314779 RepID=A0A6A6DBZ5_9PEZI|nr:hypothetical protein K469DRAFT_810324 [Zopfia rhizophila CBS 207.26]
MRDLQMFQIASIELRSGEFGGCLRRRRPFSCLYITGRLSLFLVPCKGSLSSTRYQLYRTSREKWPRSSFDRA